MSRFSSKVGSSGNQLPQHKAKLEHRYSKDDLQTARHQNQHLQHAHQQVQQRQLYHQSAVVCGRPGVVVVPQETKTAGVVARSSEGGNHQSRGPKELPRLPPLSSSVFDQSVPILVRSGPEPGHMHGQQLQQWPMASRQTTNPASTSTPTSTLSSSSSSPTGLSPRPESTSIVMASSSVSASVFFSSFPPLAKAYH
jgi:hypothetical protein